MRQGTLFVKVDGEFVPVAPCTVDMLDGGVFTTEEHKRKTTPEGRSITFRRIGTLPESVMEKAA